MIRFIEFGYMWVIQPPFHFRSVSVINCTKVILVHAFLLHNLGLYY